MFVMYQPPAVSPANPVALPPGEIHVTHAGYRMVTPSRQRLMGAHPDWRLFAVDRAGVLAEGKDFSASIDENKIVVVPPLQLFRRHAEGSFASIHLYFQCSWPVVRGVPHLLAVSAGMTEQLNGYAAAMQGGEVNLAACHATAIIASALALMPTTFSRGDGAMRRFVTNLRQASPGDLPNITTAAQHLGMSEDGFIRRFRHEMGVTPGVWRRQRRLRAAARMLREGMSLKATLTACGWRSRSQFTAAFQQTFGMTPGVWQRQHVDEI